MKNTKKKSKGLIKQMEEAKIEDYNKLNLDMLIQFCLDISKRPISEREIKVLKSRRTG